MNTQLLVQGEVILAQGPFEMTGGEIRTADAIYPTHVIEGWQIVAAELPDGFTPAAYKWSGTGVEVKPPVFVPPTVKEYTDAVQAHLDAKAQSKNYDNIVSACSYAGAPNAFQAEGQAFVKWRGDVWAKCYAIMGDVQAGRMNPPTIEALLAMLPDLVL